MGQKGGIKRMIYLKHLVFILLVMVVLTGCSLINKDEDEKEEYQSPTEYAIEQSEYIMECVVNKDKEGLKSVFSKYIAETHDLDKEIDEFFEFIDGEIVSYDAPDGHEGGYTMEDGGYKVKELYGEIDEIKTDKGRRYSIGYQLYYIYITNEKREGISVITIIDEDSWAKDGVDLYVEQYAVGEIE